MIKKELKSQVACNGRTAQQLEQGVQTGAGWCPASFDSRLNDHGTGSKNIDAGLAVI